MKKQDYLLLAILIISLFIVVSNNLLFSDVPEKFSKGSELGNIFSNLSLAYISSYIFYLIVVKTQENKNKKNIYSTIYNLSKELVNRGNYVVTILAVANKCSSRKLIKEITEKEYLELCKKTNPKDISPNSTLGPPNFIPLTYGEVIYNNSYSHVNTLIEKIFIYMPFLESDLVRLLNNLKESHFFTMAQYIANPRQYGNSDFSVMGKPMFEYYLNIQEIEIYIEENYKKYIS